MCGKHDTPESPADDLLFGWNPTPGIVSVWADRSGRALVWQRVDGRVTCRRDRFRPWIFAATLDDLLHLDPRPAVENDAADHAPVSYRELTGPSDSYRFLISARPGFRLDSAILDGASRRLKRRVGSLAELDDAYYRVGPVEQYLMATGQVYFRGLTYRELHRLQFDLETTALDPSHGRIFLVSVRDSCGFESTLEAPDEGDESRLIVGLCALIRDHDPDVIENHNLFGFDLPFLDRRAQVLGVPLLLSRDGPPGTPSPRHESYPDPHGRGPLDRRRQRISIPGRELIDTLDAVRRYDFAARDLPSHRLKDVAKHFGVAGPDRVYLAGSEVFATYRRDPERVRRYALDDVAEVDAISQRLQGATFALAGMAPRRYERVASAGPAMGILEPLLVRAYLRAGAALPRSGGPEAEEPHRGGGLYLFAAGVAERVVKADVASLYPSIMRVFGIGPACDSLGALLQLVDRLTQLRLDHKAAARTAAPGSLAAGLHDANQAAMKILINSAYGYLGAGRMALFADREAADDVTRCGREMLKLVIHGLRDRGVTLLEADTDGVYFAVPEGWSEAGERALVAEVAATLPDGIRLEYEGRYRAMFSHEVKNYAILTYDGELIMRGVAFRSSRSEPFGERFLREVLRCTLSGDVAGVRAVFLETVAALRARAIPTADVAARMRLTKTPEIYLARRATHREAQYEALLAAERVQWTPGERVRVYRGVGGTLVWLPDPDGEHESSGATSDPRDYDPEYYVHLLLNTYAGRLRKAYSRESFAQLFRLDDQLSLFDERLDQIAPVLQEVKAVHE